MVFRRIRSHFIGFSISFLACNVSTTKVKNAIFSKDSKSLSRDINSVIGTREIDVNGSESVINGLSKSELTIGLLNAKNLPTDSSIRKSMLEHIATIVKYALSDTGEYDFYNILFINKTITNEITNTTSIGKTFKSGEIKTCFYLVSLGDRLDTLPVRAVGRSIFSKLDSEFVSSLSYFDHGTNLFGKLKISKQTDFGEILITNQDLGAMEPGYRYYTLKFKLSNFYGEPKLGSGKYRIEYMIRDSVVGAEDFKLL